METIKKLTKAVAMVYVAVYAVMAATFFGGLVGAAVTGRLDDFEQFCERVLNKIHILFKKMLSKIVTQ